jgi:transcriptional regulator with GAF, ATPase, and Fis domain
MEYMADLEELRVLADVSQALNNEWRQEAALSRACQAAVELFGAQHSGLVVFDEATGVGVVQAEYPRDFGALNATIEIRDIPAEQDLIRNKRDIYFPDLDSGEARTGLGSVREDLLRRGIRGIFAAPIIQGDQVVGSFSLDSTVPREYTEEERAKCRLLASIVGGALQDIYVADVADEIESAVLADLPIERIGNRIEEIAGRFEGAKAAKLDLTRRAAAETGAAVTVAAPPSGISDGECEIRLRLGPKNRPAGVLTVRFERFDRIARADVRKLQHLARYAYVALERARMIRGEKFLRMLSDIVNLEKSADRALQQLAWLTVGFFEAGLCRILACDTRGVLLHDVAANGKDVLEISPSGGSPTLQKLLRGTLAKEAVSITEDPISGRAQLAPILRAMCQDLAGLEYTARRAWLFPLRPTREIQAWLLLADPNSAELADESEPGRAATDMARRVEGFIARTHLQKAERRQQELVARLNHIFSEFREDLSFEKQCAEIVQQVPQLLGADGAALALVRLEAKVVIRVSQSAKTGKGLPEQFRLSGNLTQVFEQDHPALLTVSDELKKAWGERFAAEAAAAAVAPLRVSSPNHTHALIVWRTAGRADGLEAFSKGELNILGLFATRVSAWLTQASAEVGPGARQEVDSSWQKAGTTRTHTELFAAFAQFAATAEDPSHIYRACLTAITAGYGLRLNRAALLLLSGGATTPQLYGEEGIGAMSREQAKADWDHFRDHGPSSYRGYLDLLRQGRTERTQLGLRITELRMPIWANEADPFHQAVERGVSLIRAAECFPAPFRGVWYGVHEQEITGQEPIAVIPLRRMRGGIAGVLVADNWHNSVPLERWELDMMEWFAGVAAEAAMGMRAAALPGDLQTPAPHRDPNRVLEDLLKELRRSYRDSGAAAILVTEDGRTRNWITQGMERPQDIETVMRAEGISRSVWETGRREVIPDRRLRQDLNRNVRPEDFRASVCLRLETKGGKRLGVVWLHLVDELDPVKFEGEARPLEARIHVYADAYERTFLQREEEFLDELKRLLGEPRDPRAAERAIVAKAQELLGALAGFLFPVQRGRSQFVESRAVASPANLRVKAPKLGDAAFEALSGGYAARESLAKAEAANLPEGTESLEAVALDAADARFAVLMLCYGSRRVFDSSDRERLNRFADEAAGVWRRASITYGNDQSRRASEWQQLVERTAKLEDNLTALATRIQQDTKADKVVLFGFDENSRTFRYPPGTAGITAENARLIGKNSPDAAMYRYHRTGEPLFLRNVNDRVEFDKSPFAKRENVRSLALLPLRSGQEIACGVAFLNYTREREFDESSQEQLRATAQVAAEAVGLAVFHANQMRVKERQMVLMGVPRDLAECATRADVNDNVLRKAKDTLEVEFANMVLIEPDGRTLKQEAGLGWESIYQNGHVFRPDEAAHARFAIMTREGPIDDFLQQLPFSLPPAIHERKIRSGLAVRMLLGNNRTVGAMLVHTRELRHFDEFDEFFLRMLATEAAFAHLRLSREADHRHEINERSMALSRRDEQSKVAAHQLSEPLNYLETVIELVARGHFGKDVPPRLAYSLEMARGGIRNSWRIAQSISGAEFGAGSGEKMQPARVAAVVWQTVDRWHVRALAANQRVIPEFGDTVGVLADIDELHLALVLEHLLANALQSGPENSAVKVRAFAEDSRISIEVADEGKGLSSEVTEWLAGPEEKPLPASARNSPGRLGLGLHVSRQILQRYGGALEAVPGDGCCLRVRIRRWQER